MPPLGRLRDLQSPLIADVRGRTLLAGIQFHADRIDAHYVCELLMEQGVLTKETNLNVVRFAPPLVISRDEIDWAMDRVAEVLAGRAGAGLHAAAS